MPYRRRITSLLTCIGVALGALLVCSQAALAQGDSLQEISGFDLLNPPGADGTVHLVALTRTGQPIPADQISFKTKDNVVRVTYRGVTLAKGLGGVVPLGARNVKRVRKGYAVRDGDEGVFVRLKFNARARRAMEGGATTFERGATVVSFPFGAPATAAVLPTAAVTEGANPNADPAPAEDAAEPPAEKFAPVVEGQPEEPAAESAPVAPAGMFEWAEVPKTQQAPADGAEAEDKPAAAGEPAALGLADEARGPSFTKVIAALFFIGMLIVVLALAAKKLRNIKVGGALGIQGEGVKVLAKYPVAKGNQILVLEVLDEVLVVSQNPSGGLTLLHHMPQERADELRHSDAFADSGMGTGFFDGLLRRRKGERAQRITNSFVRDYEDDVDEYAGTLHDLAQSLETNARTGALRETPPPSTKVTPLFGQGAVEAATPVDTKAEPIDFQELLARRAAHKRYSGAGSTLPKIAANSEPDTVTLRTGTGLQNISDVTREYRERIRSLGKL